MSQPSDIVRRKRFRAIKHRSAVGAPPGTLQTHSDLAAYGVQLKLVAFGEQVSEATIKDPDEVLPYLQKYPLTWLQVCGVGDVEVLKKLTSIFKLNPLAMEDVVNVHQRSKLEEYENNYFAISRIPEVTDNELTLQQLSIFWGSNFVLTFQEKPSDIFKPLMIRIEHGGKLNRLSHAAYLSYAILDAVIDGYFPILDDYGSTLDDLEEHAIDDPSTWVIRHIHDLKHDLHALRRSIWAQRDAVASFKLITEEDKDLWFYIRDCEDHTIQLLDIIESYRDRSSGLMDIYLASVNNRTNMIMKQLTTVATFFMPIGVLAGIYGMNFDRSFPANMPELSWPFGYEYFWAVVCLYTSVTVFIFWRKGWFRP